MRWLTVPTMAASFGALLHCGGEGDGGLPGTTGRARAELAAWAKGEFSHVLRFNPSTSSLVRNACELTLPLGAPRPLVVKAQGLEDGVGSVAASVVVWDGNAVSSGGLSVSACAAPGCQVTARWHNTSLALGHALGCRIAMDDGATQVLGTSTGTELALGGTLAVPAIFHQWMKLEPSGNQLASACVLRQSGELPNATVSDFTLAIDGSVVATVPGATPIGGAAWPAPGPGVDLGSVFVGVEPAGPSFPGVTRLKHVAARKAGLVPGNEVRCTGSFSPGDGSASFVVSADDPSAGNGMSLVATSSEWTCAPNAFGQDTCDCSCGIPDPDCAPGDCLPGNDTCVQAYGATGCTANDVRVELALVEVHEDCWAGDPSTALVTLKADVYSTVSRYDIGLFLSTDGGSALSGASCVHDYLAPVSTFGVPVTYTPDSDADLRPELIGGPYWNGDADQCGDLEGTAITSEAVTTLPAVRIACVDLDDDGSVDVNVCTTWNNMASMDCNGVSDTGVATASRCNCGTRSNLPGLL